MLLKQIDPDALALLSALVAIELNKVMDIEEQNVFGNFIVAVGSIILTMAAAEEAQKKAQEEAKTKADEAKKAQEEAKTKADEAKKAQEEAKTKAGEAKKTGATAGEKTPAKPAKADEEPDILIGREEYAGLRREQAALRRRLVELERLVAAQVDPKK